MWRFDRQRLSKILIFFSALALLGASFFAGIFVGYENRPAVEKVLNVAGQKPPPQFQNIDFNLFWDVWSRLEAKYVDKDKINRQDLIYGAARGLVGALGDPYSEFMPPADTKQFQEDISGSFSGIGAEIGIRKGVLTVISPLKDSPAERAGLKPGDKILKIDETPTGELTLNEAVRLIRGPQGTEVRLSIFREATDRSFEAKITRDVIKIPILKTEVKPGGIFVIKLYHFTENAAFEFRRAIQEFFSSGSKKLILDLRNNPGGFLAVSVDIASWWLAPGEVVARERFADGSENIHRSAGYRLLSETPTVVLINEGSASASEIVAGALRDNKGIKLIGAKTFGKGSVQEVLPLEDGSSLKVTIAKWLTPNGTEINGTGIEPDVKVELPKPENGEEPEKDLILEKGIDMLRNL